MLERQHRKRHCWDQWDDAGGGEGAAECTDDATPLLGGGAHGDGVFHEGDLESFAVAPCRAERTPALALFDPATQRRRLVWRTKRALLTAPECAAVLAHVEAFHVAERS